MSALLAQVEVAPSGLSSSLFTPLIWGAIVYVILVVAGTVLENRDHPRGQTVGDLSFAVLLLLAVYTVVLVITAVAQKYNLVVRMLEVLAIVVAFFALLLLVLFAFGQASGAIGRLVRRDRRVTTDGDAPG